jgi:hypothetical protein
VRLQTSSRKGFRAATNTIPVAVELDVPVGTFEDGDDFVELSVDLDQSGIPDPATSVRLHTDRHVSMGFADALPDGTVNLLASVSDFSIELPSKRLENIGIDVAARIIVREKTQPLPRIPLFIDTAPPIVGPVQPTNYAGFVPAKRQLQVSAWAWDAGSGVNRVEAVFDAADSGEFPAEGEFIQATQVSDREWVLSIDVGEKVGPRTLLVRGVDDVGNQSDSVRLPFDVVSLTESAARIKQQTVELAGSVIFRDDLVPQVEVKLISIPEDATQPPNSDDAVIVQTGQNGRFSIPSVAPGNYLLAFKVVIRNRVRRTEREILIEPGPRRTMQVDVDLP